MSGTMHVGPGCECGETAWHWHDHGACSDEACLHGQPDCPVFVPMTAARPGHGDRHEEGTVNRCENCERVKALIERYENAAREMDKSAAAMDDEPRTAAELAERADEFRNHAAELRFAVGGAL